MKKPRITHRIYCWSVLPQPSFHNPEPQPSDRKFYYSVRPVNNPTNSLDHGKYKSASGRNERVLIVEKSYKGKAVIVRNTNPNKMK